MYRNFAYERLKIVDFLAGNSAFTMVTSYKKLIKQEGEIDPLEQQVAEHFQELSGSDELKNQLTDLYFVGAEVSFFLAC